MAQGLLPNYARAQTISSTDARIKASYVTYPSPGGNGDKIRGYLVQPAGAGPWPAVLVIHENRGLNPYIEDVARRVAVEGFWRSRRTDCRRSAAIRATTTMARDAGKLDQPKLRQDMLNGAKVVSRTSSTKKLGATGFCWGGGRTRGGAGPDLQAACRTTARRGHGVGAQDQGAAARASRRERPAHQRDVPDLSSRS